MKVWAAIHQGPSASGRERHFAPLSWRQMIALIVRRRCRGGTLAAGRQASISGASTSHCSSVRPIAPSSKPKERPPRPRVQALTGPNVGPGKKNVRIEAITAEGEVAKFLNTTLEPGQEKVVRTTAEE